MSRDVPEPLTHDAIEQGCTCRMESVNSASIDPPEPIVNRWCPLHGDQRDPDDLLDEQRENEQFYRDFPPDADWDY